MIYLRVVIDKDLLHDQQMKILDRIEFVRFRTAAENSCARRFQVRNPVNHQVGSEEGAGRVVATEDVASAVEIGGVGDGGVLICCEGSGIG